MRAHTSAPDVALGRAPATRAHPHVAGEGLGGDLLGDMLEGVVRRWGRAALSAPQ
jgi:hypothetical protein